MLRKIKKLLLTVAFTLLPLTGAQAMEPVMSVQELTPGMCGYAKTVILGRDIQTFDIEILGVIKDGRQSEGRILAKASGDVIEQSGGVLQGMSGSPVYVNGYLIGAVSGGWKNIDNRICIITPIGEMLKIWQLPDEKSERKAPQIDLKAAFAKKVAADAAAKSDSDNDAAVLNDEADQSGAEENAAADAKMNALATPLMVGGLSERSLEMLGQKLAPYQLVPYDSGIGSGMNEMETKTETGAVTIEPGSSVGVQLVRGDISVAAIGTVTAVDGERVLAFGHSFLHRGNVGYFMTDADIISTASGVNNGFKIGVPGKAVGTINQDRESGVAGRLGYFPQVVPMQVAVSDKGTASNVRYDVQIAYHEELIPALAATIVYNAMEKSMDAAAQGTVNIKFAISTKDGGGSKIVRDNMYYASQNVSQLSINELADVLSVLCGNTVKEADIYNIRVDIDIDNKRNTASVIEAKPDKASVKPGETVKLTLKLKPYRKEMEELVVPFTIPEDTPSGAALLEVRGGGLISVAQLAMNGVDLSPEEDKNKPLETAIRELTDKNKNNDILIELLPLQEEGQSTSRKKTGDKAPAVRKPVKQTSKYIIDNVLRIGLTVEKKK